MDNFVYWCLKYPYVLFVLPFSLCVISFVLIIVALILNKKRMLQVSSCFLIWMVFPIIFPIVTKSFQIINKRWLRILLMLISPAAIAVYLIVASEVFHVNSCRYEELKFTNKEEIGYLTGLSNFPDYEYHSNSIGAWSGTHTVRFLFKEEPPASFYAELESLREEKDNMYWSSDNLTDDYDLKFFGSDHIYIYTRGWDGKYMTAPMKDMPESADVNFFIGKRGFVCRYVEYTNYPLDIFGNQDSISALSGVKFPPYKNVNCRYTEIGPDYEEEWTIMLDKKPSKEFIQQIKNAPNWTEWENEPGCYEFHKEIPMKSYDKIIIDDNSRVVKAAHGTY